MERLLNNQFNESKTKKKRFFSSSSSSEQKKKKKVLSYGEFFVVLEKDRIKQHDSPSRRDFLDNILTYSYFLRNSFFLSEKNIYSDIGLTVTNFFFFLSSNTFRFKQKISDRMRNMYHVVCFFALLISFSRKIFLIHRREFNDIEKKKEMILSLLILIE